MTKLRNKLIGMTAAGRKERGASAVEYGLVLGLIAVAIIVVLTAIGTDLNTLFQAVSTKLAGAAASSGS